MTLADLKTGEKGIIVKVKGRGAFRKRIIEMGFVKGKEVEVVKNAPLKDPIEYKILGYNLTLRKSEARLIDVVTYEEMSNALYEDQFPDSNENNLVTIDVGPRRRHRNRGHLKKKHHKGRGRFGFKQKHKWQGDFHSDEIVADLDGQEIKNSISEKQRLLILPWSEIQTAAKHPYLI